jgi:integrase
LFFLAREAVAELPEHAQDVTLANAIENFTQSLAARHKSISCQDVADKLLLLLQTKGRSKRHYSSMNQRLKRFNKGYGDWLACDVSPPIIDDFITGLNVASKTQENYRLALNRLFKYAVKIKAAPSNPVAEIERPTITSADTGILKPQQVAALLTAADDDTLPGLAISFFAGVRRAEIERLDWSEIDLEEGTIEIKAKNSKTAQRRIIPISDNLKAWLLPHEQHEGPVIKTPHFWRAGCETARKNAKIKEWPHNAGRHSFASYYLAMDGDSGKLATELGHANPRLLHQHYKELVTKKAAATYWSITPTEAKNIINMKSA